MIRLRREHSLLFTKFSTEDEGLPYPILTAFAVDAYKAGLNIAVKIGGCDARSDLKMARLIQASTIVAPMIQSVYDLKKFVLAANDSFSTVNIPKLAINIETKEAIENLHEILSAPESSFISRIIVGRTDLAGSLKIPKTLVNSDFMFNYVQKVSLLAQSFQKELFVGGNISVDSIEFLKKLPYLTGIETRNCAFDASVIYDDNIPKIINLALSTEKLLLDKKISFFSDIVEADKLRSEQIEARQTIV